ncbi:MAG: S-layer homology domain-containing protein [Clostridiales Family XIII bacterium]|jgi:uncharacterized repeat protein (TIGR02543 family)|nr:S-layer homology domain-containing protein [Clostridiales Family XIII bacterium]
MENLIIFICFMGVAALLALFAQGTILLLSKAGLRFTFRRLLPWLLWAATVAAVVLVTVFVAFGDLADPDARGGLFLRTLQRENRTPVATPERTPVRPPGLEAEQEYLLSFETGAGAGGGDAGESMPAYAVKKGDSVTLPDPPEQEGRRFTGWYADRERTVPISEVTVDGSMTVYAGWQLLPNALEHRAYLLGDPDGDFRPREGLSRAETLVMFARLLEEPLTPSLEPSDFDDIRAGAWYADVLRAMERHDIITGYPGGKFRPDENITRAEFISVCIRLAEKKEASARADAASTGSESPPAGEAAAGAGKPPAGEAAAGAGKPPAAPVPGELTVAQKKTISSVPAGHWSRAPIQDAAARGWLDAYPAGGPAFLPNEPITRAEAATIVNRMLSRRADANYIRLHGIKGFRDVSKDTWAYLDIIEASFSHGFAVENGEEIWKPL